MVEYSTIVGGGYIGHVMHGFLVEIKPGLIVGVQSIESVSRCGNHTDVLLRASFPEQEYCFRHHQIWDPDETLWKRLSFLCSA